MEDLNDKITGGTLLATEWNQVPSEIQNVIEGLSISLSAGDLDQLGKGIAGYVANGTFYTDSGIADAYVLTQIGLKQGPTAYTDGMTVEFLVGNTNAGSSTINVVTLGVKNIVDTATGGELTVGERVILKFRSGSDDFEILEFAGGGVAAGGTALQVYTKIDGTDFNADWQDAATSGLINVLEFNPGDILYTPTAGITAFQMIGTGGGGGGGGTPLTGAGQASVSSSGAAGGTVLIFTTVIEASYTLVVGAAGAGGAAGGNNGANGNDTTVTSVGININAGGGGGGTQGLATSASQAAGGTPGGLASGGTVNIPGGDATGTSIVSGNLASDSGAGNSYYGGGTQTPVNVNNTTGTRAFGAGGGGAANTASQAAHSGNQGTDGIIVVTEYF